MGIELVSFDVWDTLLSVNAYYRDIAMELAKSMDDSPDAIENKLMEGYRKVRAIRRAGGFNDSEIVPATLNVIAKFLDVNPEKVEKAILNAAEKSESEQYLIEGALEAVRSIKEVGFNAIVVGNVVFWPGKINKVLLKKAGLAKFIDEQFYADELGVSKPKPQIFEKALSKFGVEPQEALHVGDSVFEDLAGAVLARMNAVLIDKNVNSIVRLSSWSAYIIPTLRMLEQVVEGLEKH